MPQPDPEQLPWPHPSSRLPARPSLSRGRGAEAHPGGPGLHPVRHRHASPTCHPRAAGGLYPDHPTISKEGAHSIAPGDIRQPLCLPCPGQPPSWPCPSLGLSPQPALSGTSCGRCGGVSAGAARQELGREGVCWTPAPAVKFSPAGERPAAAAHPAPPDPSPLSASAPSRSPSVVLALWRLRSLLPSSTATLQ